MTTLFHGIRRQRFTVLSASSGTGKTRLSVANLCYAFAPFYYDSSLGKWCENINTRGLYYYDYATNSWKKQTKAVTGVLYIGTEMDLVEEITPILLAYMADVPEDHITENNFEEGEEERVREAALISRQYSNIWLEYVPNYDIGTIEALIAEHKEKHNIEAVFFDYIHTTVELTSEYAQAAQAKMTVREDQILFNLSTKLKDICRKYDVSIDTWTQVSGDFKNEQNRDQTIIAGAKAIINKADQGGIVSRLTEREKVKIEPYTRTLMGNQPNIVISVYKNRGGKYTNVKIWLYVDYSTMRVHDLFVTDYDYNWQSDSIKGLDKKYLNIYESTLANKNPKKRPIPVIPPDVRTFDPNYDRELDKMDEGFDY
jgi:replicative DNA helicase